MKEKNESTKEFSTCCENTHFAEMMQKVMGQQGIGSLCTEMMKKVSQKHGDGCRVHCAEMMKSMMKECRGLKQESQKTKEEAENVRDK
jgi:hypothetical protein